VYYSDPHIVLSIGQSSSGHHNCNMEILFTTRACDYEFCEWKSLAESL
jgi:hypothetical protein